MDITDPKIQIIKELYQFLYSLILMPAHITEINKDIGT